ncbi:helix-turn-helix domain-containing protein [Chryseobacterium culicis]|uniref:helix-turn-helix domain-containing protein n=1 Tax=Chryseobacterium culicis TaxID=680127 RepID=UPI001876FC80|nr:helix-turn-helix domain-containing protein [Chryseobacterium culicis]MBE4947329.1 AraC family transcriptional regulator [Chryseobacterium culicis]
MSNLKVREKEISRLKYKMYNHYHSLMLIILSSFAIIHFLILNDLVMGYYCIGGMIFIVIFKFLMHFVTLEKLVYTYLVLAPVYVFFLTFYFWKISIVNFCWFVPIPLGAYICLEKNYGLIFSCYSFLIASAAFTCAHLLSFKTNVLIYDSVYHYTDFLIFGCNILIVYLFVYYKDKIREQELFFNIEKRAKITLPITFDDAEIDDLKLLFIGIENEMSDNKHFINPKFTITQLNTIMNVKNNRISKAIKFHGYDNFNTYINSHRIKYVKELIDKNNLEKVTFMYIYTEAGFINQSTFNKTFKKFTGMTPSEYLQILNSREQIQNEN